MAGTYTYTSKPALSYHDAVRFMAGDLGKYPWSATDEEIAWILAGYGITDPLDTAPASMQLVLAAAAAVAEALGARLSSRTSFSMGGVSENLTAQKAQFEATAKRLRSRARASGVPYFGGQSQGEKDAASQDTGMPQPAFRRGMMTDNWPIA